MCAPAAAAQGPVYVASPPTKQALYVDGQTDRWLLGGSWLFQPDLSDVGVAQGWQDQSSTNGWTPVTVPNSYSAGNLTLQGYDGYVGWYRRDFTLPTNAFPRYAPARARHWILRFESVIYTATVWLNGRLIGYHVGGYLPWEIDLKGLRSGVNELVVRVDDRTNVSSLPPGPGSPWWNFGGLQREVYLRAVSRADLQQVMIRPVLPCVVKCTATIEEQATVRNVTGASQSVRLYGYYGHARVSFGSARIAPHATWTAYATVQIRNPRLWAPGHPTLYRATLTLTDDKGRPLGGYVDYSGIRSIAVKNGRLVLNDRPLDLRGVDLQEENVNTLGALSPGQTGQLIRWISELGATVIRTQYPVGALMEELADRAGILIWSEIPVWGVQSRYFAQQGWLAQAYSTLRQNILDNENHPSIFAWGIANEPSQPPPGQEAAYFLNAASLAHRLDPTRPVAMSIMGIPGYVCSNSYAPIQVLGIDQYFGEIDQGGGATDDRDGLSPFLDSVRACHPNQAVMVTEFGYDGNRNGPVEEYGTYQYQENMLAYDLGVLATKPWLSGALIQTLQDFYSFPGYNGGNPWPTNDVNTKGLIDLYGNPKPAFGLVSNSFHATRQIGPRQ